MISRHADHLIQNCDTHASLNYLAKEEPLNRVYYTDNTERISRRWNRAGWGYPQCLAMKITAAIASHTSQRGIKGQVWHFEH